MKNNITDLFWNEATGQYEENPPRQIMEDDTGLSWQIDTNRHKDPSEVMWESVTGMSWAPNGLEHLFPTPEQQERNRKIIETAQNQMHAMLSFLR